MKLNKKRLRKGASMVQGKMAERAGEKSSGPTSTPAPSAASEASQGSAGASQEGIDKLKELGQLHDQGILTDEEFAAQKTQILGS